MDGKLKNINKSEVLKLKELVAYSDGQIVSRTLVQNDSVSLTLFAFEKGEEISTHASGGDALVTVLEGKTITVEFDSPRALQIDGETILGVTSYTATAFGANEPAKEAATTAAE